MTLTMKVAFGCHLLAALILILFGITYVFRREFMPYHSVAVGAAWGDLSPGVRTLIHALMKGAGGGMLATAVLVLFVLFIPFREGAVWARWAIPAGGLIVSSVAIYAASLVALNTPADPPRLPAAIGALLLIAGLILSLT